MAEFGGDGRGREMASNCLDKKGIYTKDTNINEIGPSDGTRDIQRVLYTTCANHQRSLGAFQVPMGDGAANVSGGGQVDASNSVPLAYCPVSGGRRAVFQLRNAPETTRSVFAETGEEGKQKSTGTHNGFEWGGRRQPQGIAWRWQSGICWCFFGGERPECNR